MYARPNAQCSCKQADARRVHCLTHHAPVPPATLSRLARLHRDSIMLLTYYLWLNDCRKLYCDTWRPVS